MADFYPILARAIAALPDRSPAARRAVYDRAAGALVAQLRSLDPPLGEAEITRERLALEQAVARIESEQEGAPDSPPPAPASPVAPAAPIIRPAPSAERERPVQERIAQERVVDEPVPALADPFLPEDEEAEPRQRQAARPRVMPPRERGIDPRHKRTAIVTTAVLVTVAAIAALAFYVNKLNPPPEPVRSAGSAATPAQADNAGKINERVGDPGSTPGAANRQASVQQGGQGSEVSVAQRAILYIENPDNPQQPQAVPGRVFWRLDSESAGQGRPVETIVRATVEIPDAGFALDFTIRRNTETALPASHIIGLRFTRTGDPATDAVREVGVPQFKTEEGERGAPLSAINSPLGDNLFVAALSNVPVEVERNIGLMRNRPWVDIPIRLASGRRGIVTFEKGYSGAQVVNDAFERWR